MIAKAIYTHGIGNLGSNYQDVTQSNLFYQLILGSARANLYETVNFISSHGYEVYYIDTDGFATNCSPDELIKLGKIDIKNRNIFIVTWTDGTYSYAIDTDRAELSKEDVANLISNIK